MNFEEKNELFRCLKKNFTSAEVRKEIIIKAIKRKFSLDDFELRSILGVFSLKKLEDLLDSICTNDKNMTVKTYSSLFPIRLISSTSPPLGFIS